LGRETSERGRGKIRDDGDEYDQSTLYRYENQKYIIDV
jgi:hypothetical protein